MKSKSSLGNEASWLESFRIAFGVIVFLATFAGWFLGGPIPIENQFHAVLLWIGVTALGLLLSAVLFFGPRLIVAEVRYFFYKRRKG
ncbi:hypothetical protein A2801_02695 [Candidatus Woesebacteria bacterium RIFCSPHIGHO2_01_FULL_41_10]|uniref:Uncharacterized protein n=1 Tax=Candidatus Woesebacteria bacterium RIFCSPHIGHO2_01_FULL_41_10 TaxID=1802500 RepID=A0A1F7YNI5_9BACT|nr:MAG: hypothetical protein A2801_02695 [Candidatus Woesebacteria bacterium RIFCSPHIGHO2_01_FULL_41_10]